jgi:hypothetical protein
MKIIKLKELDLVNTIKNILNEQSGGSMISEKGYKAIEDIESAFSFTDAEGNIKGATYDGRTNENDIKKYVKDTIGLDNWFKMNELFRTQIYAFMFQSDSGKGGVRHNRWIAGLAQAIDPSVNRTSIMDKDITDANVAKAIESIKKACEDNSINKYYNTYLKVLDTQYASIKIKNRTYNYEKVWKNRPRAIERLLNGEKWEIVKKEFNDDTITKQQVTQQPAAAAKQQTPQQPAAPKQQPAAAPAKQATSAAIGGVGFLELLEKVIDYSDYATAGKPDNMSIKINSPLVGDSIFFTIQEKIYGCTWDYDIKKPYYNDGMFLNLTRQNGKVTATVNTKGGQKIPASIDKMNCKSIQ